jgi:hypothetical protein
MFSITPREKNLVCSLIGTVISVFGKPCVFITSLLFSQFFIPRIEFIGAVQPPLFNTLSMFPFPVYMIFLVIVLFGIIKYFFEIYDSNKRENYIGFILGICLSFSIVFANPYILFDFPMCFMCALLSLIEI